MVLAELGEMARERGDPTQARAYFDQSLSLSRQIGNARFAERCLAGLAALGKDASVGNAAWGEGT